MVAPSVTKIGSPDAPALGSRWGYRFLTHFGPPCRQSVVKIGSPTARGAGATDFYDTLKAWEALGGSGRLWEALGSSGRLWEALGAAAGGRDTARGWPPDGPRMASISLGVLFGSLCGSKRKRKEVRTPLASEVWGISS